MSKEYRTIKTPKDVGTVSLKAAAKAVRQLNGNGSVVRVEKSSGGHFSVRSKTAGGFSVQRARKG